VKPIKTSFKLLFLTVLVVLVASESGFSQTPFYQGRTITVIRAGAPGGIGEMRVRAVANYLKKHIPGNPAILLEFMAGAGGRKAANYVYRNARADGLFIGSLASGIVFSAVLGEPGVEYDLDKFIHLGSPNSASHYVFFTNKKLSLTSQEKLRAYSGLRIGAQSVGHPVYYTGRLFAYLLGLKEPKFVASYSAPEMDIALQRGELDAMAHLATGLIKQTPEFMQLMDFHAIVKIPKDNEYPPFAHLPELETFVKSERERRLLTLHRTLRLSGTPFVLPPGTPKDRAEILREAMRKIFADPEFLSEYMKLTGEEASPLLPEVYEKAIKELPRDPEIVNSYKILGGTQALPPR
jgi:tripartite-type tricarboxylate transporter receptor subunit TctC